MNLNILKNLYENIKEKVDDIHQFEKESKDRHENIQMKLAKNDSNNLIINVGGKEFTIDKMILLCIKDTVFYAYLFSESDSNEIFIDRDGEYFKDIITFYHYRSLPLQSYSYNRLNYIKTEAEFYNIQPLISYVSNYMTPIKLVKVISGGLIADLMEDLNESLTSTNLNLGIMTNNYPYNIIFELNITSIITSIQFHGYRGEINNWHINNGNNASMETSLDNKNWIYVGKLPLAIDKMQTIPLFKSTGKYLKFSSNYPIGIGYLKLFKE